MNNIHASFVYCILNIHTGKKYVGSTTNFSSRKSCHLYDLRNHRHRSRLMQQEYDQYGEDSLKFFVLEKTYTFDRNELFALEQRWIDKYKPEYNTNELAGNHFHKSALTPEARKKSVDKRKGRKQTKEEREKRSKSFQERWNDPKWREWYKSQLKKTPEQIAELKSRTGEKSSMWGKKRPEEFKKLISDLFSSVQYTFISPEGENVTFTNLAGNGERLTSLPYWQLRQLYRGNKKECGGWTFKESTNLGYKKER